MWRQPSRMTCTSARARPPTRPSSYPVLAAQHACRPGGPDLACAVAAPTSPLLAMADRIVAWHHGAGDRSCDGQPVADTAMRPRGGRLAPTAWRELHRCRRLPSLPVRGARHRCERNPADAGAGQGRPGGVLDPRQRHSRRGRPTVVVRAELRYGIRSTRSTATCGSCNTTTTAAAADSRNDPTGRDGPTPP